MYVLIFSSTKTASAARRKAGTSSGAITGAGQRQRAATHALDDHPLLVPGPGTRRAASAGSGRPGPRAAGRCPPARWGSGWPAPGRARAARRSVLADGDLPFLHGLEQRALHLGGGAVDLVGQDDAVEHRALLDRELAGLAPVDRGAGDVGGQQVGRELDALEAGVQGRPACAPPASWPGRARPRAGCGRRPPARAAGPRACPSGPRSPCRPRRAPPQAAGHLLGLDLVECRLLHVSSSPRESLGLVVGFGPLPTPEAWSRFRSGRWPMYRAAFHLPRPGPGR